MHIFGFRARVYARLANGSTLWPPDLQVRRNSLWDFSLHVKRLDWNKLFVLSMFVAGRNGADITAFWNGE